VRRGIVAAYNQITKYCGHCKSTTPHQVRQNSGLAVKICVVCLLRGYLIESSVAQTRRIQ